MNQSTRTATTPQAYLAKAAPDHPVLFFAPHALETRAQAFLGGFPGLVTYAVKANSDPSVLRGLVHAGVTAFDVASPVEIALIRRLLPDAALHYNNPVRSPREIAEAVRANVQSYSLDRPGELAKLQEALPKGTEVAVRFKLPVTGAAYDFGEKFGAPPDLATRLLRQVAEAGFTPALTFHPGTQCPDPAPWTAYIAEAARIAHAAGVRIARLNVGGGFPSARGDATPNYTPFFDAIACANAQAFGADAPQLLCEPGRALVGDCMALALRVKCVDGTRAYLNDGIYGTLAEARDMPFPTAPEVLGRDGPTRPFALYGPTCDSLDRLPGDIALPADLAEDDYLIFNGVGAYGTAISTEFNGYGAAERVRVRSL